MMCAPIVYDSLIHSQIRVQGILGAARRRTGCYSQSGDEIIYYSEKGSLRNQRYVSCRSKADYWDNKEPECLEFVDAVVPRRQMDCR